MTVVAWQDIVRRKREEQENLLFAFVNNNRADDDTTKAIAEIDNIGDLVHAYSRSQIKASNVVKAYASRLVEAHGKTNCLTEILFDDALAQAHALDHFYEEHKELFGPLHGVPMTVKDQFDIAGKDTTLGYVARAFHPAEKDAAMVEILKSLGAIILAKTNLPQSIMWCETENPLWGLTTNPLRSEYTPGGSTGGEGALLAMRGSLVGWGTDIGGSVRIPSHMNGQWGLKPTSSRLPYRGVPVSTEGQEHVPSAVGPLTTTLASMITTMRSVIDSQSWNLDPRVVPIPWQENVFLEIQSRPLTIGVLSDDGVVRVHPPVKRALDELVLKLKTAGHELLPWDDSGHRECIEIMDLFYSADGGEDIRREVQAGGEPFIPHVEALVNKGEAISVYEYWQLNKRKIDAQRQYNDKWNSTVSTISGRCVDVILSPTMPHSAVPHRTCRWVGYTKVWNFLDYPALSFPVGRVDASIDLQTEDHTPRNPLDAWNWNLYDPSSMDGHPIGLQIIGRRFEEEKLLGIARIIEKLLN